jgi:hypothetical protein
MALIKRQDRKAYGVIQNFFRDDLAKSGDLGYPLHAEWSGYRAVHIYSDRYRIVWRDLAEIEDYAGAEGDMVVPIEVVRVGLKNPDGGSTIYDQPPD